MTHQQLSLIEADAPPRGRSRKAGRGVTDDHGNLRSAEVEIAPPFRRLMGKRVTRSSAVDGAAAMLGRLEPGIELTGLTNGQFSLVDLIEHCLNEVGPADVSIATWTMGIYDAAKAYDFVNNVLIRRIRFLVDASMFTRRPELSVVLVDAFGEGAFRAVASHAKFATVRGAEMAVCIRSSMNLNENNRLESFDVSVDDGLTRFFEDQVDVAFDAVDCKSRSQSRAVFAGLLGEKPATAGKIKNPFLGAD